MMNEDISARNEYEDRMKLVIEKKVINCFSLLSSNYIVHIYRQICTCCTQLYMRLVQNLNIISENIKT